MPDASHADTTAVTKADERRTFLLLAVLFGPAVSVILVGSYGFLVWMSHLLLGPPGH
jgi:nitrate reductase NapE